MEERRSIGQGSSAFFHNGELLISLIGISFGGDPLRHSASLNISSPEGEVMNIGSIDVGSVITYTGEKIFRITILEIRSSFAYFQVVLQ